MFVSKGLASAVNGSVIFPVTPGGTDLTPRFRKPARALPTVKPNAVLRYSLTGASSRPKAPKGPGGLGDVGLALIDAECRRNNRNAARIARIARAGA